MKRSKRQILITVFLIAVGSGLMAYPFVSNYLYEHRQQQVIYSHQELVDKTEDSRLKEELESARTYNKWLSSQEVVLTDPFDPENLKSDDQDYEQLLDLSGDGIMGYVEIPKIDVFLPVYHGTSQQVLEQGVGHLENTSLPVGGKSTHCVLSAHTGLSDKKLFTDLVLLEKGDTFYIHTLDQILAYEVDQILTVKPEDTSQLKIVPEKDYVTMVTCTPYGVNSHRLLVRGYRIPYRPEEGKQALKKTTSSPWMRQYLFSILIGILVLILIMAGVCWHIRRSGPKGRNKS